MGAGIDPLELERLGSTAGIDPLELERLGSTAGIDPLELERLGKAEASKDTDFDGYSPL